MLSGSENFEGVDFKRAIARTPIIIGKRISTMLVKSILWLPRFDMLGCRTSGDRDQWCLCTTPLPFSAAIH